MTHSTTVNSYADIAAALTKARQMNGARLDFEDFRTAVKWRARAYHFRKLLRQQETNRLGAIQGYIAPTPWDDMFIKLDVPNKATTVFIEFGVSQTMTMRPLKSDITAPSVDILPVVEEGDLSEDEILIQAAKMLMP